jgi:hypothetical protein
MNLLIALLFSTFCLIYSFRLKLSGRSHRFESLKLRSELQKPEVTMNNRVKTSLVRPFSLAVGSLSLLLLSQKTYAADANELEKITSKVFFDVNINDKSAGT